MLSLELVKSKVNGIHANFLFENDGWCRALSSNTRSIFNSKVFDTRERFNTLIATFRGMHSLMFMGLP